MTKTFRFRDFEIYKKAIVLRRTIKHIVRTFPSDERFRLIDQIERAMQSILLNIAEGSAKRSDKDFRQYLERAIASANEIIAGFDCAVDDSYLKREEIAPIEKEIEHLIKQIGAFMKKLKS